jgi:hypothetical protein
MTPWAEIDDSDHSVRANVCAAGQVRPATGRDRLAPVADCDLDFDVREKAQRTAD